MKKLISILLCMLLVVSATAASAAQLPETIPNGGRCRNFNGDQDTNGWNPSFYEEGGKGIYVTDGDVSNGFDKFENYMSLTRTNAQGALFWRDYITGYLFNSYYVQLKLYKSNGAEAYTYNYGNGGDEFFNLKWSGDGKLYAKYREEASDPSDIQNYKYICDIDGDIAEIIIYYYAQDQYYHIAVNGELVATYLYSANADAVNVEQIVIGLSDGNVGDEIQLDYFYAGEVTSTPFAPVSLSIDTTTTETDGVVNVTYNFKGRGTLPGEKVYFAVYDKITNEMKSIGIVPIAENVQYTADGASVSGTVNVNPQNYYSDIVNAFIWESDFTPVAKVRKSGLSPLPPAFSNLRYTADFSDGEWHWQTGFRVHNTYVDQGASFNESNNKFNMVRGEGYAEVTAYACDGDHFPGEGIIKFTMSKSSKDVWGRVMGLDYLWLTMKEDGVFVNYRDNSGAEVMERVIPESDALSYDVVIKFVGSKFSLWIDNTLVVKDGNSLAAGEIYQIRMSSEYGNPGDVVSISDYKVGW